MAQKLIITHDLDERLKRSIMEIIPNWDVIISKDPTSWESHLKDAEIIAGWKKEIAHTCIHNQAELKWLQAWSAGVNSLPLREMENRGMIITTANGVHAYPISETIFALLLGLIRKINEYVRNQEKKTWHHSNIKGEIHEKTIGILGVGAIGKETAKIAKAFGMHVIGFRHSGKSEQYVDQMYTLAQLNDMLPHCDFVVITLPLTDETYQLFGSKQFSLMKTSALLVNIGRGEIVIEEELIQALEQGQIAGAGLDVFEKEPLPQDNPLWELNNVIITPHTSGATEYYNQRVIEDIFIPNLKNYLKGQKPSINLLDYNKGY
ncbi:D-2-hydroxyacid dehydrogenase [Litchfieldia salsa]|uniref:Phosphoglycerate dehydrogenase n=1 Tax=Litchfieldia salsa TaxID=930152 RepID=A0A1H0VWV6_9BACI|nr:D-2-hydroxyacid dehydrogenase [Litchfieldia salsa]SDP82833.1 Phosphoglycerate dehydrogenase [Litchfieldia salsa]